MTDTPATADGHARPIRRGRTGARRRGSRRGASAAGRLGAVAVGIAALAAGGYLVVAQRDAARVDAANAHGEAGRLTQAVDAARQAQRTPARARALVVEAYALRGLGRLAEAEAALGRAIRAFPNDWVLRRDRAVLLAQLGDRRRAIEEMGRAVHLNPRMRLPPGFDRLP